VRDLITAFTLGAGLFADAFFVAFRIPNLLRSLFAEGSLTLAFIPAFSRVRAEEGEQRARELVLLAQPFGPEEAVAWGLGGRVVEPEALLEEARAGRRTLGFVRPAADADVLQLPLRLRFRCDEEACAAHHDLRVLDWELHEMARASRERFGPQWATRFRETWGAALFERFDVHVLVSTYAQAPTRPYVAGLFYPPREREDPHAHAHHVQHRDHVSPSRT